MLGAVKDKITKLFTLTKRLMTQDGPITPAQAREQSLAYWDVHFSEALIDISRVHLIESP